MMRFRFLLAVVAFATPVVSSGSDPDAVAVVERMLRATGGADAPYKANSIAFTFGVERDGKMVLERKHLWYPKTGYHKVEGTSREGKPFTIERNMYAYEARATEDGVPVGEDKLDDVAKRGHRMWINDTYWLLMPYKLLDPGVTLFHDGVVEADGKVYDKIKVTFEEVGLTPGDTYWAFIARDTGLMERWSFVLQGNEPPPVEFQWMKYALFGPMTLAQRKQKVGAGQAVLTYGIKVE